MKRRYDLRYGSWPWKAFRGASLQFPIRERRAVMEELVGAEDNALDVYARGLRRLYPTVDALLSVGCCETIISDVDRFFSYGIDAAERLNSEISRLHPYRAPARAFLGASREHFLRQVECLHLSGYGLPALQPTLAYMACLSTEQLRAHPLVPIAGFGDSCDTSGAGSGDQAQRLAAPTGVATHAISSRGDERSAASHRRAGA